MVNSCGLTDIWEFLRVEVVVINAEFHVAFCQAIMRGSATRNVFVQVVAIDGVLDFMG